MNLEDLIRASVEAHTDVTAPPVDPAGLAARARRRRTLTVAGVGGAVVAVVAASVASVAVLNHDAATTPTPPAHSNQQPPGSGEVYARAEVMETPTQPPTLCLNNGLGLAPSCLGLRLIGWNWNAVGGETMLPNGVTTGDYVVIGTYDSRGPGLGSFTLTRPAVPAEQYDGPLPRSGVADPPLTTPCPPPPGGWAIIDASLIGEAALNTTIQQASGLDGFARVWVDHSHPVRVVNVSVAGDTAAATAALRQTWGGALCVSDAEHSEADLHVAQQAIAGLDGVLMTQIGNGRVNVEVVLDDGSLQQQFDDQFGSGVVRVYSALLPYPGEPPTTSTPEVVDGELFMSTTVIESPDHGPTLCGNVDDSYPPECGGVDLIGWDWDAVSGEESQSGTTWGDYVVFGTYDADHGLTVTRDPISADHYSDPSIPAAPYPYQTQCPEPPGGWVDVDRTTATNAALHQAYAVAEQLGDFTDEFVDDSVQPPVLNVLVTDDVDRAEQAVREVWGGPLCVGSATHTAADLDQIQRNVAIPPGFIGSAVEAGRVVLWVFHDDGAFQRAYDDVYGAGAVRVVSELQAYPGD
jgi:hypothetical protein